MCDYYTYVDCAVYPKSEQVSQKVYFREEDSERPIEPEGGYGWAKYIAERQLAVLPDVKVGIARIFHAYGPNICLKEDRSQVIGPLIRKAIRYPREDFVVWGAGPRGGPSSTSTTSWTACSGWTSTSRPRGTSQSTWAQPRRRQSRPSRKGSSTSLANGSPRSTTLPSRWGSSAGSRTLPGLRRYSAGDPRRSWPTGWRRRTSGLSAV